MNENQIEITPSELPSDIQSYQYFSDMAVRVFWVTDEIGDQHISIARSIIAANIEDIGIPIDQRTPIRIFIHSIGGDASVMWMLIDTIRASKTPVYTVNMGVASSAAGLIFMAGHKRSALAHSWFLIHKGSAEISGQINDIMAYYQHLEKDDGEYKEYVIGATGISPELYETKISHDWYIGAHEAVELGIAQNIVESLDDVIPVESELEAIDNI